MTDRVGLRKPRRPPLLSTAADQSGMFEKITSPHSSKSRPPAMNFTVVAFVLFSAAGLVSVAPVASSASVGGVYEYYSQSGDTLDTVAIRFGAYYSEIHSLDGLHIPERGLLPPGTGMSIPRKFSKTTDSTHLFADGEIVYSNAAASFRVDNFILGKRGYLLAYRDADGLSGSEIIKQLARENSIDPRILLAMLEYSSGWVTTKEPTRTDPDYPMRFVDVYSRGLYRQMMLAINYLERGYYNWRDAKILCLYFGNGESIRLAPDLNAGTVAVMYYFSRIIGNPVAWKAEVGKFVRLYADLFGEPEADAAEPLYPPALYPPYLSLPFALGQSWCFSSGAHGAWDAKGPAAAVDLAPPTDEYSPMESRRLLASATGCVVRSEGNAVVLDLDCDGSELTGWDLFYFHVSAQDRARLGSRIQKGEMIGFASSEGGVSTGVHVHLARKFNGEWILGIGALPFTLSGWVLQAGAQTGEWFFRRDNRRVAASNDCDFPNMIFR